MLQTKRLTLRNFLPEDAVCLFDYRNDNRCRQYQRYGDTSKAYLEDFVRKYAHCTFPSTEEEQHYAVTQNNALVGDISVFYNGADNCFTLGITIAPPYQHHGFSYEILQAVISQLQIRYPAVEIVALIEKGNDNSISLFKKLGFTEECYAPSIGSYVFVKPEMA